jgi:predicted HAD superfamily phosphohydrolase
MYACGGVQDYPGISREEQIVAFAPYFHLLNEHDVRRLWDTCNKFGFFGARKQFVDPLMREKEGVPFVDQDATDVALDQMAKPDRLNWVDRWLEDFRRTGADTDTILRQVSGWLSRRQTIEAFRLVCEILMTIGERKHLAILDVYSGTEEDVDSLRKNARYAVMRRSLI